ncbi:MAG: MATE family efflux transporter [Endomicrobium sp.]|jgi:MATE family multidrug resistance protein|nr:MATE family efflux transporter [Endomicrobium sp.]
MINILNTIKKQYTTDGGYKEFLKISIPLFISTSIGSIQLFIDRIFLSMYSKEAFTAATLAGILYWSVECIFFGTVAYIDVFVARYYGAKKYHLIGPAIWQGVYLTFLSAFLIFFISFFSNQFFTNIGHIDIIAKEESKFFRILCYGAFPNIVNAALSSFYSGRCKTRTVLLINFLSVVLNIILDFCLIFGNYFFNEMGIIGAALSTNISSIIVMIIYIFLIASKKYKYTYNTMCFNFNFPFFKKLIHYGLPNGIEFFFDFIGFGIFMMIIGKLGEAEFTASTIIATVNYIFSMPIVGIGMATSIMVSNYLGKNQSILAKTSVKSAIHIVLIYLIFIIFILLSFMNKLIHIFSSIIHDNFINSINVTIRNLLIISSIYLIFNACSIVFAAAIKGAGDTIFVLKKLIFYSILLEIIPAYISIIIFHQGVYLAWIFLLFSIIALFFSFYFRYKSNKWIETRVIRMNVN